MVTTDVGCRTGRREGRSRLAVVLEVATRVAAVEGFEDVDVAVVVEAGALDCCRSAETACEGAVTDVAAVVALPPIV